MYVLTFYRYSREYVGVEGVKYNWESMTTQSLIRPLLDLLEDITLLQRCLPLPLLSPFPVTGVYNI